MSFISHGPPPYRASLTALETGLGGHAGDLGSLRTISTAPGGASLGVADDDVHPDPLIGQTA